VRKQGRELESKLEKAREIYVKACKEEVATAEEADGLDKRISEQEGPFRHHLRNALKQCGINRQRYYGL